jgi:TRAP transporter TAXI family solute receptor
MGCFAALAMTICFAALGGGAARADSAVFRDAAQRALLNANIVGIMTGGRGGMYSRMGADLSALLDDRSNTTPFRVLVMLGRGSLANIDDVQNVRGVDVALVQSDVLASLSPQDYQMLRGRMRYIAALHGEDIHILAGEGINSLQDLEGKRVNVDVPGSGSNLTGHTLFARLGIHPAFDESATTQARAKLLNHELDAMVFVVGKPAAAFTEIQLGDALKAHLHFLPVPEDAPGLEIYKQATLTAADYPSLIRPGDSVPTRKVQAVMAVFAWDAARAQNPAAQLRYAVVKNFVDKFFASAAKLHDPGYAPTWCEVDLAASVPGWDRFEAASEWLAAHKGAETRICPDAMPAPPPPVPACDAAFRTEMKNAAGVDPDLAKPFWQDRFADWKAKAGSACR